MRLSSFVPCALVAAASLAAAYPVDMELFTYVTSLLPILYSNDSPVCFQCPFRHWRHPHGP